jgi:hypothetical protein
MIAGRCQFALFLSALSLAGVATMANEQVVLTPTGSDGLAPNAWVNQASASFNSNGSTTLQVSSGPANTNQRSLVEFDLSTIPSSGIKSASLTLFMSTAPTASRTYQVRRITSLWTRSSVSWTNRVSSTAWGTAGGDVAAVTATTNSGAVNNVALTWTVTPDLQQFFGAAIPSGNFGWMVQDMNEGQNPARTAIFSSNTGANVPSLKVQLVQNVQGFTATAGNAQIILNWTYPPTIGTVLSPTTGVLILRQATNAIGAATVPADGTTYTVCSSTISGATVVFNNTTMAKTFNDSATGNNPGCAPANDTIYYYKVFTQDAAHNYSENGATSNFVPMTVARPSATASNREAATWLASTGATTLAAPGLIPGTVVVVGSNSNLVSGVNPSSGAPVFNPVSTDGAITGRPTVLDSSTAALAQNVAYIPDSDGFVYAMDASSGAILWMTNPTLLATNGFTMAASVVVRSLSNLFGSSYLRTTDLVVVGTRNAATTSTNQIVGLDGSTGATVWQVIGNSGGTPAMDIVVSNPYIDYKNNAIWVTTNSNGGATQPSLWKINIATGALLAIANLNNISSSPTSTLAGDVVFVGNDSGTLFAINPANAALLASFAGGDTKVIGTPVLLTNSSPYTVVFAGARKIQAVTYNASTKTFSSIGAGTWSTAMPGTPSCAPSAPVGFSGLSNVYTGCGDGNLYQLDAGSGAITGTLIGRAGDVMGDPSLDLQLNLIMAGNTDGRVFTFPIPF